MLNDTFKTISVIKWQSVELVEETIVLGEYHRHDASHRQLGTNKSQTLSHYVESSTQFQW